MLTVPLTGHLKFKSGSFEWVRLQVSKQWGKSWHVLSRRQHHVNVSATSDDVRSCLKRWLLFSFCQKVLNDTLLSHCRAGGKLFRAAAGPWKAKLRCPVRFVVRIIQNKSKIIRRRASTEHSPTFRVRRYVVIATKPVHRLHIDPPNSAQLEGILYHSTKLHPGPCSSMGKRRGTDTQTAVTTIHYASSTTHAKCNKLLHFAWVEDHEKCIVVTRVCVSVCLSVRGRMPTVLYGPGCNLGQW